MFVSVELWRKLLGEIVPSNKKIFCRTCANYKSLSVNPRCIESKLAEIVHPPLKIIEIDRNPLLNICNICFESRMIEKSYTCNTAI